MKSIRIQFDDEDYQGIEDLSRVTSDSIEEILSKGVALYRLLKFYEAEGKHLAVMDDDWKVFAQLDVKDITKIQKATWPPKTTSGEQATAR